MAHILRHPHLYNRLGDLIDRRRLAARRLGLLLRLPFEKGAAWRLPLRWDASCLRNSSLATVNPAICSCSHVAIVSLVRVLPTGVSVGLAA